MKTMHIKDISENPIEFMRKLYKAILIDDETFHFVNWSNAKWQGYKFKGRHILLRVDDEKVQSVEKWVKKYYGISYDIYDYPFPNRKGHLERFGLGKKGIEAKYPDLFHKIYHIYSIMSLTIKKPKERRMALMQLLHIPLNVYACSFVQEAELYSLLAYQKMNVLTSMMEN